MILSGAEITVRTLIEQGCDIAFGYPGGQILPIYDALHRYRDQLHHILTAHEQAAAHAADGYARSTGRVGVCIATSGPGATNLVTGIATAHMDSVPIVAITGNVPSDQIGTDCFQEIDITGITLPITKHNYVVGRVEELADTIREAFLIASSGRPGPVLIDIPRDIQSATCEYTPASPLPKRPRQTAKEVRIREAADCIREARRPFLYFGGGLIASDAAEELLALAEKIDAPIGCSLMGISGIPSDHPRFLGMLGMHGGLAARQAMDEADCIVALGVRFNDRAMLGDRKELAEKCRIVHIDVDGAELSKTVVPTCALRGDLRDTLRALSARLPRKTHPAWKKRVTELKQAEQASVPPREGLTPQLALQLLEKHLGENTPVATDVGQHQMWAAQTLHFSRQRRFLTSGGLGTMGFGIGASIGAYFGTGERAVLITGDGSFGMSLQELATAVTYRIPLVILLLNNGVLGMVRQWQTAFFDKCYSNTVLERKTDFVQLIRAFGGDGVRVEDALSLEEALNRAFACEGPFLIDCRIDRDEQVLPMAGTLFEK